jgi:hypothetical protein
MNDNEPILTTHSLPERLPLSPRLREKRSRETTDIAVAIADAIRGNFANPEILELVASSSTLRKRVADLAMAYSTTVYGDAEPRDSFLAVQAFAGRCRGRYYRVGEPWNG